MGEHNWLMKKAMEIVEETLTKPPGRYKAEEVMGLYIQPNFKREQIENMQECCELLDIDFNNFLEQHYTGRRLAFTFPEEYFNLFSDSNFNNAIKNAIHLGVDRKKLADYILYVFKDSIEHATKVKTHYTKTIELIGNISFDKYTQKIEEVKSYRKENSSDKVRGMKHILRESVKRMEDRLNSHGLEHVMFDVRYYGSLYFGDPSKNPDIDGLIYFDEILSYTRRRVVEHVLKIEVGKMLLETSMKMNSIKASHYHAIELELLMKKLDELENDIKILAPEHEGNFIIDFSRAPSELFLSESIIPESSLPNFEKAQELTLISLVENPFLRASSYVYLEKIIENRKNRNSK
jgi:hypothetical protein